MPACGLASRARAALGIMPAGTMAGAWGASTGLGQARAGNARLDPRPRKPGLKLRQGSKPGESRGGAPRGERARGGRFAQVDRLWRASAPVAQAGGNIRFAWRGHLTLASVGAPPPLIFLEAKNS